MNALLRAHAMHMQSVPIQLDRTRAIVELALLETAPTAQVYRYAKVSPLVKEKV